MIAAQILHQRAKAKEEQNTRVGPSDNLEQSKEKNYPPTSLVASALYLLLVGRKGSLCALCAPSGEAGTEVGAQGTETPDLPQESYTKKPRATPLVF